MPRIKIKALPKLRKAVDGFQVGDPTLSLNSQNPNYNWTNFSLTDNSNMVSKPSGFLEEVPRLIFTSPAMPNAATDTLELSDEEKKEAANQQNYQNWMQKPQNEMSQSSWAQPFQQKFDLNPQYDPSKKYNKKGNEIKPFDWNKFGRRMGRVGAWGNVGLGLASATANYFDNRRKQKDYDKWARESRLPDNYYAVDTSKDRGDYDVNEGMFRPDQLGFKSKGMFANSQYAQRNFSEYGGMIKAADGMSIPGTELVQQAILPDLPGINFSMPQGVSMKAPASPSMGKKSSFSIAAGVSAKGNDVATRTNNPGNMKFHPWMKRFGATSSGIPGQDGGIFASFPDLESGLKAYQTQLFGDTDGIFKSSYYKADTPVDVALRKWSNNGYGANIYPAIQGKTLGQLTQEERDELAKRQIKMESGQMYKQLKKAGIFAKEGGQIINNTDMRIKIVGTPKEEYAYGGQPPYSGQSDYGLYIGQRNLYKTMAKHPYEDNKNKISQETPSENNPFVLEAEDGETIYRPDGTHMEITGKKHSEGGEKLTKEQAPEGSFIYSDTNKLKIKDPNILKMFGKGGNKGLTPATIAKQYETNKYLAMLQDPNTDNLTKKTARKMVDNYERKLAELALVQESMKGFPQGIPDVAKGIMMAAQGPTMEQGMEEEELTAKYGGSLKKFVDGGSDEPPYNPFWNPQTSAPVYDEVPGPYDPNNPMPNIPSWYTPWLKSATKAGGIGPKGKPTVFDPKNPNKFYSDYTYWKDLLGKDFSGPEDLQQSIYDYIEKEDPKAIDAMWESWGAPTAAGLKNPKDRRKGFVDKYFGARTADLLGWKSPKGKLTVKSPTPSSEDVGVKYTCGPNGVVAVNPANVTPGTMGGAYYDSYDQALAACGGKKTDKSTESKTPEVPTGEPDSQNIPAGWTSQDIRNLANAAVDYSTLKKYHPYYSTVQPVLPEMVPVDWRGYAAALQSGTNAAAQQLGTYQPGQSMAANLSALAGQQAEGLGRYIGETDRANAAAATQLSAQRANILNQFTQYNAALRDKAAEEENVYDDRYRAAERLARKGVVKAWDQGEDTASKIYNTNISESPYYTINPFTQRIQFNSPAAKAAWEASTRGGYQEGSGAQNQALGIYNSVYEQAKGTPEQKHEVALAAMRELLGGSRQSTTEYPYAPAKNRTTKTTQQKYGGSANTGYSYYNPFLK